MPEDLGPSAPAEKAPVAEDASPPPSDGRGLWALFLLGLSVAALCIFWKPLPVEPEFESYDILAWNLLRGEGFTLGAGPFSSPDLFRTPGYSLFLVPFYWLFRKPHEVVYWVQALLHAAVPLLVFSLVRRAFSRKTAFWAGSLVALYPLTAVYVPTILAEPVSVFTTVLSVWLFLWTADRPGASWAGWVGAGLLGVLFAFGTLLRPAMAFFSLFLFGGAWAAGGRLRRLAKPFCVAHLAFAAAMAPWAIRNYRVSGDLIPLSIESPLQLWLATLNYGPYTDRYWTHPLYLPQDRLEVNRSELFFDRNREPYPVEVRLHLPERLRPVFLHYRVDGEGAFRKALMREVEPGRFRGEIPPQPWGSRVRYFLTMRDPWREGEALRHPSIGEGGVFYYRVARSLLDDLGEEVIDVNFLARQAAALAGRVSVGAAERRALDFDGDGRLTQADLEEALFFLRGKNAHASFPSGKGGERGLSISFPDGSRLDVPSVRPGESVYPRLLWGPLSEPAVALLVQARRGSERLRDAAWRKPTSERLPPCGTYWSPQAGDRYRARPLLPASAALAEIPCYWKAGMGQVAWDLRRSRVHGFFFRENLRRLPMAYFGGSLLRIPRIWVIVGTPRVGGQTYLSPGADWLYPSLTVWTAALLVLALSGYGAVWRTWRSHWYLAAPVLYVSLIHAPFHPEARYSLPARPFLLVYAALALLALGRLWRRRSGRREAEAHAGGRPE